MVADLKPFCFSLCMEGGVFLRVNYRLHGSPKNFQGQYFYGEGDIFKRVPFSLIYPLFMAYLKKVRFDFSDFIIGFLPDSAENCQSLF